MRRDRANVFGRVGMYLGRWSLVVRHAPFMIQEGSDQASGLRHGSIHARCLERVHMESLSRLASCDSDVDVSATSFMYEFNTPSTSHNH